MTAFAVGDEVLGYTNNRASHAEFVLTGSDEIVAKPPALSWPEAGALFVVGTSAYALVHTAEVSADDVVLVSAAAGGVGSLASQWARNLGAAVVGLARPVNHEWLRGYGVPPVDYTGADLGGRIRQALDGRQVRPSASQATARPAMTRGLSAWNADAGAYQARTGDGGISPATRG